MYNMIVEDERDVNGIEDFNYDAIDESSHAPVFLDRTTELMEFIRGLLCFIMGYSIAAPGSVVKLRYCIVVA
ncbi:hypothetical protein HHK36_011587 [Tetracentron sinense]|uniref:Uncharacterized protein n=1 Tax=Tetracentron sinense TaxID=13715 RepID=A0A835DHC5_TETSI|nr:hypothetical protein HHK36_011587 [Tetracentron sinense]